MSVRGCGVSSPWQWPPDEGRVARSNPADGAQYLTSGPFAIVEPEGLAMYADQSVDDDAPHTPERFRTTESYTHWDRGLAIVAGIIGIVLLFVLLLTTLPIRDGTGAEQLTGLAPAPAPAAPGAPDGAATAPAAPTGPNVPRVAATVRQFPYVRRGPGVNFAVIMTLQQGQKIDVVGRSQDRQWYQIVRPDNASERAWVSIDFLTLEGDGNALPEVKE